MAVQSYTENSTYKPNVKDKTTNNKGTNSTANVARKSNGSNAQNAPNASNAKDAQRPPHNPRTNITRSQNSQQPRNTEDQREKYGRFIAVRRRNVVSYFIGNIDSSVDETDVWDYLSEADVKPTHVRMFYGKHGSSAKINFHHDDQEKVENPYFWPTRVTCRKWVSKAEWDREKAELNRQRKSNYHNKRYDETDYEHYEYDDYDRQDRQANDRDQSYDRTQNRFSWFDGHDDDEW